MWFPCKAQRCTKLCITVTRHYFCVDPQPPVRERPVTRSASRAASLHSLSDASSDSLNHSPGKMLLFALKVKIVTNRSVEFKAANSIEKHGALHSSPNPFLKQSQWIPSWISATCWWCIRMAWAAPIPVRRKQSFPCCLTWPIWSHTASKRSSALPRWFLVSGTQLRPLKMNPAQHVS